MSSQKLRFNLHTPCSVDFSDMGAIKNGFHCHHCNKDVVDFVSMSDEEIINFFKVNGGMGNLCGRLTQNQMENGIEILDEKLPFKPSLLKKVAAVTIIGLSIAGATVELKAQVTVEEKQDYTIEKIPSTTNPADTFVVKTYKEPAEYGVIQTQKLVMQGGITTWTEINCPNPSPLAIPINKVKAALQKRGYYKGAVLDDVIDEQMEIALINFRKDNGLGNEFKIDEALIKLLGLMEWEW